MAVGKSGERATATSSDLDGACASPTAARSCLLRRGAGGLKYLKGTDIVIDIDLGIGRGRATVWTCDLTHGYIDINGANVLECGVRRGVPGSRRRSADRRSCWSRRWQLVDVDGAS